MKTTSRPGRKLWILISISLSLNVIGLLLLIENIANPDSIDSSGKENLSENTNGALSLENSTQNRRPKIQRPQPAKSEHIRIVDHLETIASASPDLIKHLNLSLFDNNLDANISDWKILGVDDDVAKEMAKNLKNTFRSMRDNEVKNFKIVSQSETQVQIALPKLDEQESATRIREIESAFSKAFNPNLSKQMARLFVTNHPAIASSLNGRDRVVTIAAASPDTIQKTNRMYEIRTQVLYEGIRIDDAIKNINNYSEDTGIELVERIPNSWKHLFGNSD